MYPIKHYYQEAGSLFSMLLDRFRSLDAVDLIICKLTVLFSGMLIGAALHKFVKRIGWVLLIASGIGMFYLILRLLLGKSRREVFSDWR